MAYLGPANDQGVSGAKTSCSYYESQAAPSTEYRPTVPVFNVVRKTVDVFGEAA